MLKEGPGGGKGRAGESPGFIDTITDPIDMGNAITDMLPRSMSAHSYESRFR